MMKTVISIAESSNAKTNSYSHHCDVVMHTKHYAVCLDLIDRVDSPLLPISEIYSDCKKAIKKSSCPALKMRKKEIEKGEAIYFKERKKGESTFSLHTQKQKHKAKSSASPEKDVENNVIDVINGEEANIFEDAINHANKDK